VICLNRPLPVVAGQAMGAFAKFGIEVELQQVPNSDTLRSDLAAGKADIAFAAVDNAVAMVETAGVDVVILMGGEGSANELIAQPEIKTIADLRGKTLIVDAPNTAFALQLRKILLLNGLVSGRDFELRPVGSTPIRLQAMRERKDYAASILGPPYSMLAREAGLVSLTTTYAVIGPYQGQGSFALRRWAGGNEDLLARYLAAYVETQRWLLDPSNRQQAIEFIKKDSNLTDALAAETYSIMMQTPAGYATDARFDMEGFANVLELRAEIEGQWGGKPPAADKYYDPSYYRLALERLK
jgi:ABC-type nitrate/sulfonate/bicarbonate transport system substrate-binding protein